MPGNYKIYYFLLYTYVSFFRIKMQEIPTQFRFTYGDGVIQRNNLYYFSHQFANELILQNPLQKDIINSVREPTLEPSDRNIFHILNRINYTESQRTIRIRRNKINRKFKNLATRSNTGYIPKDIYFPRHTDNQND